MKIKAELEVARLIQGYGFKGVEKRKTRDGEEYSVWATVWTKDLVREGDVVEVTGDLSVKLEEFTGRDNKPKQIAAIHINNAQIKKADAPF
jgi:hypothetical protein